MLKNTLQDFVKLYNQIVYTIFRKIWNQMEVRLDLNQPENINTIWFQFDLMRFPFV